MCDIRYNMDFIISDIFYDKTVDLTKNYLDVKLYELGPDSFTYYRISGYQLSTVHEWKSLIKKILPDYCPKLGRYNEIDNPVFYIILTLPLTKTVEVPVNLVDMTWVDLFKIITEVYLEIEANQDKYGVHFWGHSVSDLDLYGLIFRKDPVYKKNIIHLYIDS